MENHNEKFGKILLKIVGLGFAGYLIYRSVRDWHKGMEELEKQRQQEIDDLKGVGIDTNKFGDRLRDEEDNSDFVKVLFKACISNSDLDEDMFAIESDPDNKIVGIEDCLDENVIRIMQKIVETKFGTKRYLDFIIDIPERAILGGSYRDLTLGNYLSTFAATADKMSREIVRFSDPARHKMFGYVIISRKTESGDVIEYRQLKNEVYGVFADEKHDGLSKFVKTEKEKLNKLGYHEYIKEAEWLFTNCPDLDATDETLLIENIVLQYVISFPIRSNKPRELYGIDIKTATECIKYLTEKMVVERDGCNKKVSYRHLMFNAQNEQGFSDRSCYYTLEEDGRIVKETYTGFDD